MESNEQRRVIEVPEHWSECHVTGLPFSQFRLDCILSPLSNTILPFGFKVVCNYSVEINFLSKVPDQPLKLGFKDRFFKFLRL